jgi:hypothetical protein
VPDVVAVLAPTKFNSDLFSHCCYLSIFFYIPGDRHFNPGEDRVAHWEHFSCSRECGCNAMIYF